MQRRLTIIQGDLTLLPLKNGAIINPSNTGLVLTSQGLAQKISRRAGPYIQQKMHTARSHLRGSRLDPGQVLVTDAGQLSVDYLIHIALVGARKINARLISRGLLNAYDKADELGVEYLGLPPLGPGISKFPMEEFMEIFWRVTAEELPRLEHVQQIFLALEHEADFEAVKNYASEHIEEMDEDVEVVVSESGIGLGMFSAQFES